ncbi:MAG: hypothetical protein V1872_07330 [bacterium]
MLNENMPAYLGKAEYSQSEAGVLSLFAIIYLVQLFKEIIKKKASFIY